MAAGVARDVQTQPRRTGLPSGNRGDSETAL
jgi:hypothetical protein